MVAAALHQRLHQRGPDAVMVRPVHHQLCAMPLASTALARFRTATQGSTRKWLLLTTCWRLFARVVSSQPIQRSRAARPGRTEKLQAPDHRPLGVRGEHQVAQLERWSCPASEAGMDAQQRHRVRCTRESRPKRSRPRTQIRIKWTQSARRRRAALIGFRRVAESLAARR